MRTIITGLFLRSLRGKPRELRKPAGDFASWREERGEK